MNLFFSFILSCTQISSTSHEQSPPPTTFPPITLSCQKDEDCGISFHYLTDDNRCCSGCTPIVSNQSWREETRTICAQKNREECPAKKCAAPPQVECKKSRCQRKAK